MDNSYIAQDISSMEYGLSDNNINNQNKHIILPNCTDLDWAQIIYAINYKRILFIDCYQTWYHFHAESSENAIKYNDYTPEELYHRFLQRVLPNIFEYELTEQEFHLLNLLDLHTNFERTSAGFKIVEQNESLLFPKDEAAIQKLITSKDVKNEENFYGSEAKFNNQIITISERQKNSFRRTFNLNAENSALLSVALCSDEELPNCELLPMEEIIKRLSTAKSQFQNNGHQLENVNISLNELLKKLETISKLKEAVTKLVNTSFCK